MKNKLLCLLLSLFFSTLSFANNKHFDTMVIFGDSMSDNGNLYRYLWYQLPVSPPYYEGHFSNGPVWVEQLYNTYYPGEDDQEGFQDYAVGGAGAVLSLKAKLPYTLGIEISNYLYWHTYGKKETTLYTIWIGANNYLNAPKNVESITESVADAIGDAVERLIDNGGNKFLVVNMPNLAQVPYAEQSSNPFILASLVQAHNDKLATKVKELQMKYSEATIVYFDIYSFFNQALNHPGDYGITNTTEACYLGGYTDWLRSIKPNDDNLQTYLQQMDPRFDEQQWEIIKNNPQLKEAAIAGYMYQLLPKTKHDDELNCDAYVFWDTVHPTTKVHYFIAQKARELLDEAGIQRMS